LYSLANFALQILDCKFLANTSAQNHKHNDKRKGNTHTHNRFTALWNLSGTTRVSRYQKKHSPTIREKETNIKTDMAHKKLYWSRVGGGGKESMWERFVKHVSFEPVVRV